MLGREKVILNRTGLFFLHNWICFDLSLFFLEEAEIDWKSDILFRILRKDLTFLLSSSNCDNEKEERSEEATAESDKDFKNKETFVFNSSEG
jgi:hypothetical protein